MGDLEDDSEYISMSNCGWMSGEVGTGARMEGGTYHIFVVFGIVGYFRNSDGTAHVLAILGLAWFTVRWLLSLRKEQL